MSDQPTKAEVEEMLTDLEAHELVGSPKDVYEFVVCVFKAYLAQGEELAAECIRYGKLAQLYRQQGEDMVDVLEQRDQLKAENLALTEELHQLKRYIGEMEQEV